MKNLIALAIMSLVAFSFMAMGFVSAQDEANVTTDQNYSEIEQTPGITPDSPFYGLERAIERVSLALTFNKAAKAQKGLAHAKERLLEVSAMIDQKKASQAEKAREAYDSEMEGVSNAINGMNEDTDESVIEGVVGDLAGLRETIQENEMSIEALRNKLADENLTDEERAALESELEGLQNATDELQASAEQKRDDVKNRWRAVTGKNESEIDSEESQIEDEMGVTVKEQKLAEMWIERTQNALDKLKARISQAGESEPETEVPEAEAEAPEVENETEVPEVEDNETEAPEESENETESPAEESNETEVEVPENETESPEEAPISPAEVSTLEGYVQDIESKLAEARAAYAAGNYEQVLEILKPINNFGRQISVAVKLRNVEKFAQLKEAKAKTDEKLQEIQQKLQERTSKILSKVNGKNQESENESEDNESEIGNNKGKKNNK